MSRPIRFIPEEGALVDITCRTIQSRYLLRPDPALKEIVLGVLGRAQRLHPVEISAFFVASNHYHLLAWVPDVERMADFMGYFQTNVAREVGRLRKWRDKIWSRRYEAIVISDEPAAQVDRLRYVFWWRESMTGRASAWSKTC
jgi:REP element-mobilizing transposase RayT